MYTDKRLRKAERLHLKLEIDSIFKQGKMIYAKPLAAKFLLVDDSENLVRIMTSAPKRKVRKANDRNRYKRRMKEAYRLIKPTFSGSELPNNKGLHVALILTSDKNAGFLEIENAVASIFESIFKQLKNTDK